MAYSTQTDVERAAGGRDALVQLADTAGIGEIDPAEVTRAIEEADALFDSYAQERLATPVAPPIPTILRTMSAAEAVYALKVARNANSDRDDARHEERLRWFQSVGSGAASLGVQAPMTREGEQIGPAILRRPGDDADSEEWIGETRLSLRGLV